MALTNKQIGTKWWRKHLVDQRVFDGNLNAILRDAARESSRLINSSIGDNSFSAIIRRTQYMESRYSILAIQDELWGRTSIRTTSGMRQAIERAKAMWEEVNARLGKAIPVDVIEQQFKSAANHAIENIASRYINNIDLASSVYKNNVLAKGQVDRAVNRGILLNKSAKEIAADVASMIRPDVQGGISYAAKRLGRTELNNAFHETTRRSARAQPWVEGMKWELSGSHPRPDICNEYAEQDNYNMGGGVFPNERVPGKPHPQCLCYVTAITPSDSEFVDKLFNGDYDDFLIAEGSF